MGGPGGSKKDVAALVTEHYALLYRYAYRLSGSASDAEDLTQETFCQAQNKLAQLRDWTRAKGWLFAILRNAYLHRVRHARLEKTVALDGLAEPAQPLVEWSFEVDQAQLQHALNDLPEVFRTPLILYYFEDFGYKEIAEQMNVPMGTVMSRLARAKGYLRQKLQPPRQDGENKGEGLP